MDKMIQKWQQQVSFVPLDAILSGNGITSLEVYIFFNIYKRVLGGLNYITQQMNKKGGFLVARESTSSEKQNLTMGT